MRDQGRTREQLLAELAELRRRVAELETSTVRRHEQHQHAIRRPVAELEAIHRTGQRLQQLRPPQELAQAVIAVLEQALSYEYCDVLLLEQETGSLLPFAYSEQRRAPKVTEDDSEFAPQQELRLGCGITGWVAAEGQSLCLGDVSQDPRYVAVRPDIHSELCVPIKSGDRILGVVNIETVRLDAYAEADQRVLETVAAQLAVAIENSRLYERVQHQAEHLEQRVADRTSELAKANEHLRREMEERRVVELEIHQRLAAATLLQRVSGLIASASDMTEALQRVCEELAGFLRVSQAGFALLNDERSSASVVADVHPPESPSAIGSVIPVADNPSMAYVLEKSAPLAVEDAQTDPRLVPVHELMRRRKVRSILIVPVIADGDVIGTLGFDAFESRAFEASQVDVVQQVANQAGQLLLRKRVEAALERRAREMERLQAFNESIVEGVAEGILLENEQGCIRFANRALEEMVGIPREELLGRHWTTIFSDTAGAMACEESMGCSTDVERRYEATLRVRQGQEMPVMVSARPIQDGDRLTGVLSAFTDIRERVEAERAVEERRLYLETVLTSVPDAIATMDAEHRIVEWNPGAEKLFGYTRAEAVGWDLDDLVTSADTYEQAIGITRRALAGEMMVPMETVRTCKDGSAVDVIIAGSPILMGGELAGTVSVYTDIRERKRAERALRRANRGLRMLGECNAVLSRAREEPELLHQVCRIAVEIGGYRMAWVGVAERDEAKSVRPVAQAGFEEGYLDRIAVSWADSERGSGPTGTAIRTHKPAIARNVVADVHNAPWREQAAKRGYASSIALPLIADGRCLGALSIYASEPEAFDQEEVSLLTEMADNVAYGLAALRTRAERAWMEGVLQRYAERLELLQQVGRAILEAQSPEAIAQATLTRIGNLVPCQRASILVFGREGIPRTLAVRVSDEAGARGEGSERGEAGTVRTDARGQVAPLSIPLMAQGELIGILRLTSPEPDAFTPEHIEIAYQVAAPLAVAIQHARLNAQIRTYAGSLEETISQRTRELRSERDRSQAILESLGEAVIVTDAEGTILYANPATLTLTGYSGEELLGQSWRLLVDERQDVEVYEHAREAMDAGQAWRSEMRGRRRDGIQYDAAATVTPVFDAEEAGTLIGWVWVQRDITPLKEAERSKDRFVSNVSHELRTPLSIITLIVGNLDRLYSQLDEERRRTMIQSVREHVGVLNDLVGDILEISRIDSGRVSLERRRLDLVQVVREEMAKQQPLALRKLQRLEIHEPASPMESGAGPRGRSKVGPLLLRGNEGQLRQIVRNLLNNAIKFTPTGGEITCDFRWVPRRQDPSSSSTLGWGAGWPGSASLPSGQWLGFRIVDSGIGIERDDLQHLFERFYRVEAQGDVPGSGLGLAIARELAELHGGQIAVSSEPGEGSIFAVYLPMEKEG